MPCLENANKIFTRKKINVAVIGATGYVGLDLLYLLSKHPRVNIKYLCAKNIKHYVGNNYCKYVVNKEDFNEPRPVLNNHLFNNDITVNFGIEEIREEIKNEEYLCQLLENEYTFENNLEDPIYDDY